MHKTNNDIITALATPYGRSAIGVIRVSGKGSIELVNRYLSRSSEVGKIKLCKFIGEKIDGKNGDRFTEKLMTVCYKAPNSYTGEDCVELFPHGNPLICDCIIKTLIEGGARLAERGEFTSRAFFNGKVDLVKCEALADIIDAQTNEQLFYGNKRYDGEYKSIEEVEKLLNTALSSVEAVLHYSDELEENEADNAIMDDVYGKLEKIIGILKEEKKKFGGGRIIAEGFRVALIGEPNAGKSTLLNALTESDRAIVTPIAGTTRDTLDGVYVYKQKKFVVTDTAGLTETDDPVEKIGVLRAVRAAEKADAVVLVGEKGNFSEIPPTDAVIIRVNNKCDEQKDGGDDYISATENGAIRISAKHGINITALKERLYDACPKEAGEICNHRQFDCVCRCLNACMSAEEESKKSQGLEIVAAALYEAYSAIEQLYGRQADERVLDSVFERFCVGK